MWSFAGRMSTYQGSTMYKLHCTWIVNGQAYENRNAAVPDSEGLIASPVSNRLVDVDTGSTYIFICAKEKDYKCAWSTAYKHFYKLKTLEV